MKRFVHQKPVASFPYNRTEYTLLSMDGCRTDFIQAAAIFFVQSWMSASIPEMLDVWRHWDDAPGEEREHYLSHFDHLFSNGILIDDPTPNGHRTAPIGTFSETMLRWLRTNFEPKPLVMDPVAPLPTSDGKIDFVEITGLSGDYASLKVTLWEVKSSDSQVGRSHNTTVYRQLEDYPRRFFCYANCLGSNYSGNDIALRTFLKQMGRMARNRQSQVHYGVFITYDSNIEQIQEMVPNLHNYPVKHPSPSGQVCHHLALLLIPDFKDLRLGVWRSLHLL